MKKSVLHILIGLILLSAGSQRLSAQYALESFTFDTDIYSIRECCIPGFHYKYDDYLQYAPAALTIGLKAGGYDSRSSWGERAVVFALWSGVEDLPPTEFLRIYRLSGTNRHSRTQISGRFVLAEEDSIIYAAQFTDIGWDSGLTQQNLIDFFRIIRSEWSNL